MPVDRAGSDVAFLLHRGAGAYICGEETAVIDHFGITDDLASGCQLVFVVWES